MKKNLKIVSAAAAALLAVAPVVATAANVNADLVTNIGDVGSVDNGATVKVSTSNIVLNKRNKDANTENTVSGSIIATIAGKSVTGNLEGSSATGIQLIDEGTDGTATGTPVPLKGNENSDILLDMTHKYGIEVGKVSFNLGSSNANKQVTVSLPKDITATDAATGGTAISSSHDQLQVDSNGYLNLYNVTITGVSPVDLTNAASVFFATKDNTRTPVTTGSINMTANGNTQLNTNAVIAAAEAKYGAFQQVNAGTVSSVTTDASATTKSLTDALKALKVTPDAAGWFTAPKSFSFNLVAKSSSNNATASLPVTVTVPNGKETTPATEQGTQKTLMHVASTYDKNGKLIKKDAYHAYASIEVMPLAKGYYKVANKDEYIKAGNFDGTQRTVRHNSYEYRRTASGKFVALTHKVGKKHRKVVVKSGTQVTTFGSRLYNKAYYRIAKNRYIKAANF